MSRRVRRVVARRRRRLRVARRIGFGIVALAIALMIGLPASVWEAPKNDFAMSGFDSTLMYSTATTGSSVALTRSTAVLVTEPGGHAVAHLVSSPLSFDSRLDFVVQQADVGADPFTVAVTSPYLSQQFQLAFASAPNRTISVERVVDGRVSSSQVVGGYEIGQPYRLRATVDRERKSASISVDARQDLAGSAIFLSSTRDDFESHAITRRLVPVEAGASYALSTKVVPSSPGLAGVSIAWYDSDRHRIDLRSSWSAIVNDPTKVRTRTLSVVAPEGAAYAQPELAVSGAGAAAFLGTSLSEVGTSENLLPATAAGTTVAAWKRAEGQKSLASRDFTATHIATKVTAAQFPELFDALRMALTVESTGGTGIMRIRASDYDLEVPHQRWLATRVTGTPVRVLSLVIGAAGFLLLVAELWDQRTRLRRSVERLRGRRVVLGPSALLGVIAVAVYFGLSFALSHLGSLNADAVGARVWTYIAAQYGPGELYFMPNVSSAEAVQWQGEALQEAGFPYGPTMAYVFAALAALYRFGVHQPALGTPDALVIDTLVRFANSAFGLVAAALVVIIVRRLGVQPRSALAIGAVFLFAPALLLASAVWATTQAMSMVFLLAAIYAILRRWPTLSWLLLAAAMMTRPQNLIAAVVIGAWLLVVSPWRQSLRSIPIALAAVFLGVLPLTLTTAPSLPVDVMVNALFLHVGNGNDAWTVPVSWGAPGPWPLVEMVTGGATGVGALLFPATTPLIGGFSYFQAGSLLFGASVLVLLVVAVVRRRALEECGHFILLGTLAVLVLLQLKTGAPSYHMMQPTVLAFLLVRALPRKIYFYVTGSLSVTTAWSMLALAEYWLSEHPLWSTGFFRPDTLLARVLLWSVESPWCVGAMCLLNTSVLVLLTLRLLSPRLGLVMVRRGRTERSAVPRTRPTLVVRKS